MPPHRVVACRACKAPMIFLEKPRGWGTMPVDAETVAEGDRVFDHKRHRSHHATCPNADQFRQRRRPQ